MSDDDTAERFHAVWLSNGRFTDAEGHEVSAPGDEVVIEGKERFEALRLNGMIRRQDPDDVDLDAKSRDELVELAEKKTDIEDVEALEGTGRDGYVKKDDLIELLREVLE